MTRQNFRILCIVILISVFCYGNASRLRKLGDMGLAMELIEQQYIEETDSNELYESAMAGIFSSLDSYSQYIPKKSLKPFQAVLEQQFGGLGIRFEGKPNRERLTVVSTLYDSPAFRAGIKPGDILLELDGVDIADRKLSEVSELIRGKEGSLANLKLERAGEPQPLNFSVARARIEVESVLGDRRKMDGQWEFGMQADPTIGYFHLEIFGERTVKEFQQSLSSIKNPRGVILDLRDNTGGLLHAAIEICDMFLNDGPIASTRGRNGVVDEVYTATPGTLIPDSVPIVILINEQSASASEILAACLQDRNRAVLVGMRTYGKGNVQNVIPLEGGQAAMRITTAYYYPPSGRKIHRQKNAPPEADWGVLPDQDMMVSVNEEGVRAIYERFRKLSDPLFTLPDVAATEENTFVRRDPTLRDDPQLLRGLQAIDELATKAHVDN